MNADEYLSLAGPGHAQTRVLGSRFLGTAHPLFRPDALNSLLEAERKLYHDATHWCWALRTGLDRELVEKSADAGEPHGTAGIPILREIQKREITGCAVIITRYFGGTKLGTGGLARAYAECAGLALDAATVERRRILASLRVECPFDEQGLVYALAHRYQAVVEPVPEPDRAVFRITLSPDAGPALVAALRDAGRGRISAVETS
jgi:putative IMPACT (imprinted ancient) family translation regulator